MRKGFILLVIVALMGGCESDSGPAISQGKDITGLASPVRLDLGSTSIYLTDYFTDVSVIDSVFIRGKNINLPENKIRIFYRTPRDLQPMTVMEVWAGDVVYSIPVFRSEKKRIDMFFNPKGEEYESVQLAGEFNGWVPARTAMAKMEDIWETSLFLSPGTYQYRISLDGHWQTDPWNPDSVSNNAGGFNSVLTVPDATAEAPKLLTDDLEEEGFQIKFENQFDSLLVLWQNQRMGNEYIEMEDGEIEINLPENAADLPVSFVRVWAWNEAGRSNEILVPLKNGKIISDPAETDRNDMHTAVLYNVFVDRFFDGNTGNNEPVDDPEIRPPANYHGGDIEGIVQKLDYFRELGINSIWVSPLVQNPKEAFGLWKEPRSRFSGYHGYWPVSLTQIDYRFGTPDDLHDLVAKAHEGGMNVLLDFVANHVHEDNPIYRDHPEWATELYLPDGSLNTERWDEYRLTTWFDVFLPTLNLEKPEVTEMLSDSAVWWIETYGLDGFRHDATKHIPELFWRTLTFKIKEQVIIPEDRNIYQIGETYGNADLISSYVGSGMLNGQFDFNVYDAAIGVFGREEDPFGRLHAKLKESLAFYGEHNLMGYISGNQDRGRFTSYAGGDLLWGEDAKLAGWTRDIGVGDPLGYDKMKMLMAFNMTIPGIPVIYYGDEFGMPGGNDPDNRRMMRFGDDLNESENETLETTRELISIRKNHLSLMYGDFVPLLVDEYQYAYARKYFDETAIVIFNKQGTAVEKIIELPGELEGNIAGSYFAEQVDLSGRGLQVNLEPWSFAIIIIQEHR